MVFNKLQLHNILCCVQTRTVRAIFAAVKPTQALSSLTLILLKILLVLFDTQASPAAWEEFSGELASYQILC